MKYFLFLTLFFFVGCINVREFNGASFTVRSVKQAVKEGRCEYEIVTNFFGSPNITYFDDCGKWQVNDKVHFVKD